MIKEFKLPDLGEGLKEATLVSWNIQEGDVVKADQAIAEVETDKATTPLPSPYAGKVVKLHGQPGEVIKVGAVLVAIETDASAAVPAKPAPAATPAPPAKPAPATASVTPSPAAKPAPTPAPVVPADRPVLAAPATRRLARERGVDLRMVPGSGPGGRITTDDVMKFSGDGASRGAVALSADLIEPVGGGTAVGGVSRPDLPDFAQYGPIEKKPASPIRKRIAQRMALSQSLCATVTHIDEADVTELENARRQAKDAAAEKGYKLTILTIVMKAVAAALKQHPSLNATYDELKGEVIYKHYYHLGIAVDSPQGLLVPVVRDVDRRPITELAKDLVALSDAARTGKITAEQMRGGSFTITNIGAIGGLGFTPVINWPEVAILGLGRTHERLVRSEDDPDEITGRLYLPMCLSFDHRLIDGADAARFMNTVKAYLERPVLLLAEM